MTAVSQSAKVDATLDSAAMLAYVLLNRMVLATLNDVSPSSAHVLSQATNTTGVKTVGITNYTVDGVLITKAATDPLWTLTGAVVPALSFTKYLVLLNAAGTASVLQSSVSQVALTSCVYPSMPDGATVVGIVTVATAVATTFTPGTTSLAAAGITVTYASGTDKALFPLIADSTSAVQLLQASKASPLGLAGVYA